MEKEIHEKKVKKQGLAQKIRSLNLVVQPTLNDRWMYIVVIQCLLLADTLANCSFPSEVPHAKQERDVVSTHTPHFSTRGTLRKIIYRFASSSSPSSSWSFYLTPAMPPTPGWPICQPPLSYPAGWFPTKWQHVKGTQDGHRVKNVIFTAGTVRADWQHGHSWLRHLLLGIQHCESAKSTQSSPPWCFSGRPFPSQRCKKAGPNQHQPGTFAIYLLVDLLNSLALIGKLSVQIPLSLSPLCCEVTSRVVRPL